MTGTKKKTFDFYKHPTQLLMTREVIALNNKFENLKGYGVLCCLMEMCGRNLDGKIYFNKSDRKMIADSVNLDVLVFDTIIDYLRIIAKLIVITEQAGYLKLNCILLDKQIANEKVKREDSRVRRQEERIRLKRNSGVRTDVRDTKIDKRKKILAEYERTLMLTENMLLTASRKFPALGSIKVYWRAWVQHIKLNYMEYWGQITEENYETMFYVYLNQYTKPLLEALTQDPREDKDYKGAIKRPMRFHLED